MASARSFPVHLANPGGGGSRNWEMIRRSVSTEYLRGAPGRGASCKPAIPCLENRTRHLLTVDGLRCIVRAISLVVAPLALSSTMRARCASRCPVVPLRAQDTSVLRSFRVSTIVRALPAIVHQAKLEADHSPHCLSHVPCREPYGWCSWVPCKDC